MKLLTLTLAALFALTGLAFADPNGGVDDQPPGQSQNPNDDRSGPGASGPGQPPGHSHYTPYPELLILVDSGKDNKSDHDKGGGNQPHAPGQTTNPNPGKLFDDTPPVWLDGFILIGSGPASGPASDPPGKPSGPQGPGQHGQPGQEGNSGP